MVFNLLRAGQWQIFGCDGEMRHPLVTGNFFIFRRNRCCNLVNRYTVFDTEHRICNSFIFYLVFKHSNVLDTWDCDIHPFQFVWINVLTTVQNDNLLFATRKVQFTVFIHRHHITCVKESTFIEYFFVRFFVIQVSTKHLVTTQPQNTNAIFIFITNFAFVIQCWSPERKRQTFLGWF